MNSPTPEAMKVAEEPSLASLENVYDLLEEEGLCLFDICKRPTPCRCVRILALAIDKAVEREKAYIDTLEAALGKIMDKAGSHTIQKFEADRGESDPSFGGIFAVALNAIRSRKPQEDDR